MPFALALTTLHCIALHPPPDSPAKHLTLSHGGRFTIDSLPAVHRQINLVLCHLSADGWYPLGVDSRKAKTPGGHYAKALPGDVDRV